MIDAEQQYKQAWKQAHTAKLRLYGIKCQNTAGLSSDERADLEWKYMNAQHDYNAATSELERLAKQHTSI